MDRFKRIEKAIDHTLLSPSMTIEDLKSFCFDAKDSDVASVCIPPRWVKDACQFLDNHKPVCTVIGFPNGYTHPKAKAFEIEQALIDGAEEIDYVLSIGDIKMRNDGLLNEIISVRRLTEGHILKIIIESGALNEDEIRYIVMLLNPSGIDYIKTSTGFNFPGASLKAVEVIKSVLADGIAIKASGGIRDLATAESYLDAGVDRIGASKLLHLCRNQ